MIASLMSVTLLVSGGCTPVRISPGVTGSVVDSETSQPIAGATVSLHTTAVCLGHGSHPLGPLETRTDGEGRFRIVGGVRLSLACPAVGFRDRLEVHAPGYLTRLIYRDQPYVRPPGFDRLASEPVDLDRIRYDQERQALLDSSQHYEDPGPAWREQPGP